MDRAVSGMRSKIRNEAVLGLLKKRRYDFVSGSEIACALGVTRAAVWKKVNTLREMGYGIEASRAKGYRLTGMPGLSAEDIRDSLSAHPRVIGREIVFYDSVGSTNTAAAELAGKALSGGKSGNENPEGAVIIASGQTGGRGRRGRSWISPPGKNLYMSIIVTPDIPPMDATALTLMTAVACAAAVKKTFSLPASIKWPNDIMVSGKKLGGILTEIKADMDRIFYAVIGIGINVNLDTEDMPGDIRRTATSLKAETGKSQSITQCAVGVLEEMDRWYGIFLKKGIKPILEEWTKLASTLGKTVEVSVTGAVLTGVAEGINDEGMLMLRLPDGSLKKVSSGDVAIPG